MAICDSTVFGFTMLSGNAAMVGGCMLPDGSGGAIDIIFSQSVYGVAFMFATAPVYPVQLAALFSGSPVGSANASGTDINGNGEGFIQFGGGLPSTAFDEIQLTTGGETPYLSIDNVTIQQDEDSVPEPANLILVAGPLLMILARRRPR